MARQRNERNEKNKEREVAIEGQRDYKNGIYIFYSIYFTTYGMRSPERGGYWNELSHT